MGIVHQSKEAVKPDALGLVRTNRWSSSRRWAVWETRAASFPSARGERGQPRRLRQFWSQGPGRRSCPCSPRARHCPRAIELRTLPHRRPAKEAYAAIRSQPRIGWWRALTRLNRFANGVVPTTVLPYLRARGPSMSEELLTRRVAKHMTAPGERSTSWCKDGELPLTLDGSDPTNRSRGAPSSPRGTGANCEDGWA